MIDIGARLEIAFEAYAHHNAALGRQQLQGAVLDEPVLQEPAGIITPIRNYASRLLANPNADLMLAVHFIDSLFTNPPEILATLQNFHRSEMAAVWVDVAFRAYALGRLDLVRRAIGEAATRMPSYFLNRGVVSVWFEAIFGNHAARTFRDLKPGALARRVTHWRRRVILDRYFASSSVRKLHMGCGGFVFPGWMNADLSPLNRGGVIHMDATEALPIPDNILDFVFSEHFIEHLNHEQGRYFLSECFRTLRPGGVCRLATPNLAFLVDVYTDPYGDRADYAYARFTQWVRAASFSRALVLNNAFRNWGHQCLYDLETLSQLLTAAGFSQITVCQIGQSQHASLRGLEKHSVISDPEFNALETIVLEAQK